MKNTRIFEIVEKTVADNNQNNDLVEVWLPPVNHPEGELIFCISKYYIPALIATLRNINLKNE